MLSFSHFLKPSAYIISDSPALYLIIQYHIWFSRIIPGFSWVDLLDLSHILSQIDRHGILDHLFHIGFVPYQFKICRERLDQSALPCGKDLQVIAYRIGIVVVFSMTLRNRAVNALHVGSRSSMEKTARRQ